MRKALTIGNWKRKIQFGKMGNGAGNPGVQAQKMHYQIAQSSLE
jgi:hypothetical protein